MPKLKKIHTLVFALGVAILMQLLCGCGLDHDDGAQAIKNTLECKLSFKKPEKDADIITLFKGKENEPVFPDVDKEKQELIDEISRSYFGSVPIDTEKKNNLVNKILNMGNIIKYEIMATGTKIKDGDFEFQEYIVTYEYPDFEKIYSEARTIVKQDKEQINIQQIRGDVSKKEIEQLDQLLYERINTDLYVYYDKTFSDMENIPMKKSKAKYYVVNIKDNIYAQAPMGDRLLTLREILDLSYVAPFVAKRNLYLIY